MHEIERWIDQATQKQNLTIRKLPKAEAVRVQSKATSRYIKTSSPSTWWWNFKRPVDEHYDRNLVDLIP